MQISWTFIAVRSTTAAHAFEQPQAYKEQIQDIQKLREDAESWALNEARGRWSKGGKKVIRDSDALWTGQYLHGFYFRNPQDALLFKLTFGGR